MKKLYLALTWTNHIKVKRPNGKWITRDEYYSEITEKSELLSKVLGRIRKAYGSNHPFVEATRQGVYNTIDKCVATNSEATHILKDSEGRKLASYVVRPLNLRFELGGGEEYIVSESGLKHVGGSKDIAHHATAIVHSGIVRPREEWAHLIDTIEEIAQEESTSKDNVEAAVSKVAEKAVKQLSKKGNNKGNKKGKKKVDKPEVKCDTKQAEKQEPKQEPKQETKQQSGMAKDTGEKRWSAKVRRECEKFTVDPNNPPSEKPWGMTKKIWAQIKK